MRSAAFRGALWITLIALLATGAALTLQYVQTTRLLSGRMHALVDDEAAALVERYRAQGVLGVAAAIQRQEQVPRLNEFFYLLADADGAPLAGNLAAWPAEVSGEGYTSFVTEVSGAAAGPRRRWVEARAVVLGSRFRLLVGSISDERMVLRERYLGTLFWSFLATGVVGLLFGFWYSRRGLAFVDAAAEKSERFLAGRLEERLPVSTRGDEYDRLALALNETFAEVERLIRSLRAATEGLAHDLRTPLTRIRARLELADLGAGGAQDFQEVSSDIRRDLDALLQLIDEVLALARAEATVSASFIAVQLDQVVAEAIELFAPLAEEKQVRLVVDLQPAAIVGARSLLARMTTNLLDNAIKYSPAGGTVSIRLALVGEQACLRIADSGPGIPEEKREEALTRFVRLDASRSQPGSGLGLSIVAAAARVHRATLELGNDVQGLTVEVRFRAAAADVAALETGSPR